MSKDLPILLKFELNSKKLKLRLDKAGLSNFELGESVICEITLEINEIDSRITQTLQKCIGQVFEYETFVTGENTYFQFWGDYSRIENEVICTKYSECSSHYTKEDLVTKGKVISALHSDALEKLLKSTSIHYSLIQKLKSELNNELRRNQMKIEFYQGRDTGKSQAFVSQTKIFEKLLKILTDPVQLIN